MRKINAYNFLTLNGFFKGLNGDLSWHRHGGEEAEFAKEGASSQSVLLFGRVTYEMMASYWPTPMAMEQNPGVAEGMNASEKIVFSNTIKKADWSNTMVIGGDIIEEMKKLKQTPGNDMTILGSGSIISQFTDHGLIDTYQLMVDPVALPEGTPIFNGIRQKLDLKLIDSRVFKSGVILLTYEPL